MRLFKKLATGFLFTLGFVFLLAVVVEIIDKADEEEASIDAILGGLAIGVPAIASGGWIARGLHRDWKKAESDRIQSTFYRLLEANNGKITVLRFAMETQLPAAAARQYLDENARCFNAEFEPLENGDIVYQFYL